MAYSVVEFQSNETVFKQGDSGVLMYLIKEGEVEILQDLGGFEKQVAVLESGDFFGEMAVLEDKARSHSVRALTPTKLVEIDRAGFARMLERNAEIAVRMIRKLGQRLAHAEDMDPKISSDFADWTQRSLAGAGEGAVFVGFSLPPSFLSAKGRAQGLIGRLERKRGGELDLDLGRKLLYSGADF